MLFSPSLPFSFPQISLPPAKAPRHFLPFSLSEWDVRMRRDDNEKDNENDNDDNENCCWNTTTDRMAAIRRSRSWISTNRCCWTNAKANAAVEGATVSGQRNQLHSMRYDEQQQQSNTNEGKEGDDDASSHTAGAHSSFYLKFCNSLTMRRSYERQRRPEGSGTSAKEADSGAKADDATSLDTWLSRRTHRRRNGFNLTPAMGDEGNTNSRIGRLVSCSFGKLREVFSLSSRCGNGIKPTEKEEEKKREKWKAPPKGTSKFHLHEKEEEQRKERTAPPEGTPNFYLPRQEEEKRENWTASPEGTSQFDLHGKEQKEQTAPPEGKHNANLSHQLGEHCRWLCGQIMLNGEEQNGQWNVIREWTTNGGGKANGRRKNEGETADRLSNYDI